MAPRVSPSTPALKTTPSALLCAPRSWLMAGAVYAMMTMSNPSIMLASMQRIRMIHCTGVMREGLSISEGAVPLFPPDIVLPLFSDGWTLYFHRHAISCSCRPVRDQLEVTTTEKNKCLLGAMARLGDSRAVPV